MRLACCLPLLFLTATTADEKPYLLGYRALDGIVGEKINHQLPAGETPAFWRRLMKRATEQSAAGNYSDAIQSYSTIMDSGYLYSKMTASARYQVHARS